MTRLVVTLGLLVAIPEIVKLFFDVSTTFQPPGHRPDGSTPYNPFGEVFFNRDDLATATVTIGIVLDCWCCSGTRRWGCGCGGRREHAHHRTGRRRTRTRSAPGVGDVERARGIAGVLISPTLAQISELYYTPLVVAAISGGGVGGVVEHRCRVRRRLLLGIIVPGAHRRAAHDSIVATNLKPSLPSLRCSWCSCSRRSCATGGRWPTRSPGSTRRHPRSCRSSAATSLTCMTRGFGLVVGLGFFDWSFRPRQRRRGSTNAEQSSTR